MWLHNGKVFEEFHDGLVSGYRPVELPTLKEKGIHWNGGKISLSLWESIMGFMIKSYDTHKEETLLWLMYNLDTGMWDAWAPPQHMNGMSVSADHSSPEFLEQRKKWGAGWVVGGTVHHHCEMKAFASGTDDSDEVDKDGVHITLGYMDKVTLDCDVRFLYGGVKHKVNLLEFVDSEVVFMMDIPIDDTVHDSLVETYLLSIADGDFPEQWMENVKKKVYYNPNQRNWQTPVWNKNSALATYPNTTTKLATYDPLAKAVVNNTPKNGVKTEDMPPVVGNQTQKELDDEWDLYFQSQ